MNMIPKRRKNKLNQKSLDGLKEAGMYFFNDAPAIAVKVTKNQKKSFYGSYSISKGADAEGQYARTGITYDDGYNYWYSVEKNGAQDNWFIERGKDFSK
jgi:hypothetical protein